jgi:hypothetical protein
LEKNMMKLFNSGYWLCAAAAVLVVACVAVYAISVSLRTSVGCEASMNPTQIGQHLKNLVQARRDSRQQRCQHRSEKHQIHVDVQVVPSDEPTDCPNGQCWRRNATPVEPVQIDVHQEQPTHHDPLWVPLAIMATIFTVIVGAWYLGALD